MTEMSLKTFLARTGKGNHCGLHTTVSDNLQQISSKQRFQATMPTHNIHF